MNTDVEDLLREGMERFTAEVRAPVGLVRQATRRRRRRLLLRSAAGAVTTLTAGAVALAAVGVPGARIAGGGEPVVEAAYVVNHVDRALTAATPAEMAQMTVTTTVSGSATPNRKTSTTTADEWSYGRQWRSVTYSSAGHPAYDEGVNSSSAYTLVSYPARTWARQDVARPAVPVPAPLPAPVPAISPRGCATVVAALPLLLRDRLPGIVFLAGPLPAVGTESLRAAVSCGTLVAAGHQRVNGSDTIELKSRPGSPISETIWVSPGTYLPVRVVVHSSPGAPVVQETADITWLPATAQNLAKLTVPIPAGFREVSFYEVVVPVMGQSLSLLPRFAARCLAPAGPACASTTIAPLFGRGLPGPPHLPIKPTHASG